MYIQKSGCSEKTGKDKSFKVPILNTTIYIGDQISLRSSVVRDASPDLAKYLKSSLMLFEPQDFLL